MYFYVFSPLKKIAIKQNKSKDALWQETTGFTRHPVLILGNISVISAALASDQG